MSELIGQNQIRCKPDRIRNTIWHMGYMNMRFGGRKEKKIITKK
jgi:hypothetical protein